MIKIRKTQPAEKIIGENEDYIRIGERNWISLDLTGKWTQCSLDLCRHLEADYAKFQQEKQW